MSDLTITLEGSEVRADFFGTNAWLRNDGASTIYAGRKPGVVIGADGVVSVPAGSSAPVFDAHGTVYLIGTGSVQLIGSDYSNNPFKTSAQGGSGADEVARAAIEAHAGNSAIHLTAEQINSIDGGKTVEKSSSYTLDNAVDYPLVDMRIYGKSTQQQYSGKNLFDLDSFVNNYKQNSNYNVSKIENGFSVKTIKDTTGNFVWVSKKLDGNFINGATYTISSNNNAVMNLLLCLRNKDGTFAGISAKTTILYDEQYDLYVECNPFGTGNTPVAAGSIVTFTNVQLELGDAATEYEPYVGGVPSPNPDYPQDIVSVESPTVTTCGKNLLNYNAWKGISINNGTAVFENNGVTLTATSDDCHTKYYSSNFPEAAKIPIKEGETITLSWEETDNKDGLIVISPNGSTETAGRVLINNKVGKVLSYTATEGISFITFRFGVTNNGDTISYKSIQIEKGSTATAYEPYIGSTASLTSALPLCGIPVSEGGNYTDSTGQQWIADEVVYNADGSGKIVKRTMSMLLDGSDDEDYVKGNATETYETFGVVKSLGKNLPIKYTENMICNNTAIMSGFKTTVNDFALHCGNNLNITFGINMGITTIEAVKTWLTEHPTVIIYPLRTPQEIPLTAEEMSQLQSLQTFDGITNISNDKGAEMRVKYCTNRALSEYEKPVIDGLKKQIDELKSAVLSLGGNV